MAKKKNAAVEAVLATATGARGMARERVIAEQGLHMWRPSAVRFTDRKKAADKSAARGGRSRWMQGE